LVAGLGVGDCLRGLLRIATSQPPPESPGLRYLHETGNAVMFSALVGSGRGVLLVVDFPGCIGACWALATEWTPPGLLRLLAAVL
jgi:hypothetical protein